MKTEYRIVPGFGHAKNGYYELHKRYLYHGKVICGWALLFSGTYEKCEKMLKNRKEN